MARKRERESAQRPAGAFFMSSLQARSGRREGGPRAAWRGVAARLPRSPDIRQQYQRAREERWRAECGPEWPRPYPDAARRGATTFQRPAWTVTKASARPGKNH